jgi:hypothetical protein
LSWEVQGDAFGSATIASATSTVQITLDAKRWTTQTQLVIEPSRDLAECSILIESPADGLRILPTQNGQTLPHELAVNENGNRQLAKLRFSQPVRGPFELRIHSHRPAAEAGVLVELGQVEVEAALQQSGTVEFFWSPDLWVQTRAGRSCESIATAQLSTKGDGRDVRQAFRFRSAPASVEVRFEPAQPMISAQVQHELLVGLNSGRLTTRLVLGVRGARLDEMALLVPRTWRGLEASPANLVRLTEVAAQTDAPTRELKLSFAEPIENREFNVSIQGDLPLPTSETHRIDLPTLDGSGTVQGTLTVKSEARVRPMLEDAGTEYLLREPVPTESEDRSGVDWYFRLQPGPSRLSFRVEPLPTLVEASVECELRRAGAAVEVRQFIRYRAPQVPMDEVTLEVPTSLEDVRVSGDLLTESADLTDGLQTIVLRNPSHSAEIRVDYRYQMESDATMEIRLPLVLCRGVTLAAWRGRVFCDRGMRAEAESPWINELPAPSDVVLSGEQAVRDVRPASLDAVENVLALRFEPTAMLATYVVSKVLLDEVMPGRGARWGKKRWLIAKHRSRDLAIHVPAGARAGNILVDGRPVDATPDENRLVHVQLPAVDAPCTLEMSYHFSQAFADGALAMRELESPFIAGDVAVEQVRWRFHVADDRLLLQPGVVPQGESPWGGRWWSTRVVRDDETDFGIDWLKESDSDLVWGDPGTTSLGGRMWQFDAFNRDLSIRFQLVVIREPFWILICSGTILVLFLLLIRQSPAMQLRCVLAAVVVLVGLLAIVPELTAWLWIGGRWGLAVGLLAVAAHYILEYRRTLPTGGLRTWSVRDWVRVTRGRPRPESKTHINTGASAR